MTAGPLALVGGTEFLPGNEPHDELLVGAARALGGDRTAFVIATAAARQGPDRAVATARRWFAGLGLTVEELPVRTRRAAGSASTVEAARRGNLFYLCGGDPGIVPATLGGTPAWEAVVRAWQEGAVLAGSSAGAMALGGWTLIRARMPGDARRAPRDGLGIVPRVAVLPHYSDFGHGWRESAASALGAEDAVLVGIDERTAAVWQTGSWRAMGTGSVVVIHGDAERRFSAGEVVEGIPEPVASRSG